MIKSPFVYLALLLWLIAASCDKQPISPACDGSLEAINNPSYVDAAGPFGQRLLILNEGGFSYGNASISHYYPASNMVENNVFNEVNNLAIGDILQSAFTINEELILVVNNSQKVLVLNPTSMQLKRSILGFTSPRYGAVVNDSVAIFSDLVSKQLLRVNTNSGCEIGRQATSGWTEEIIAVQDQFWIIEMNEIGAATMFANILRLDASLNILETISLPILPQSVAKDNQNNIWVLCSGLESENVLPALIKINTQTNSIEYNISFDNWTNPPLHLSSNKDGSTLYFSSGSEIYSFSASANSLPATPLFTSNAQTVYGISIPDASGEIYISDAKNYIEDGEVFRYSAMGALLDQFTVSVIPSKIIAL